MTANRTRYVSVLASALMVAAFFVSEADQKTHDRNMFFLLERLAMPALALVALVAFAIAFRASEERRHHRLSMFIALPGVAASAAVLAFTAYGIYRIIL